MASASMTAHAVSCIAAGMHEQGDKTAARSSPISRRTGFVTASDGVRIYYEVCGSGPAIVLVHGLGGNHAVWFHQVAYFARDHTVVTVSQRGFAPSGGDPARYEVDLVRSDLQNVMDAADVAKAVVVGQSMGGWTALAIALDAPERVQALVLADTLAGIDDPEISAARRQIAASAAGAASGPPPLGVHPALSAGFSAEHPELGYLYQTLTTFGAPAPEQIVRQLFAARVTPEQLAALRVPTLLIVGTEDRLFPPALIRKAAAHIRGAEVREIARAGHSPYFEQPGEWNRVVDEFASRAQQNARGT